MKKIVCYNFINDDNKGIIFKCTNGDVYVCLEECAKNYATENLLKKSKCVATRDITTLTFTFYSSPKIQVVFRKNKLIDIIFDRRIVGEFFNLQKMIIKLGYSSYDLS